jgi:hypothetical protein
MRRMQRMLEQRQELLGVRGESPDAAGPQMLLVLPLQLPQHPSNPLHPYKHSVLDAVPAAQARVFDGSRTRALSYRPIDSL